MAKAKARYFGFIVYPESAPQDWKNQLKETHGAFAISPLHSPDGENDKPHHHVIYCHGNTITLNGAKECIPEGIAANGYVEPIRAPRNYQRYLIHLDDPEKEQFEEGVQAIEVLNGFPLDLMREFSSAERREQMMRIHELIFDNDILEYSDLIDITLSIDVDLHDHACKHTIYWNTYISSRRNKRHEMDENGDAR